MEQKLSNLFDFQRFAASKRLAAVIAGVASRCASALSDEDLEMVSAAGESEPLPSTWKDAPPLAIPEELLSERIGTNDDLFE